MDVLVVKHIRKVAKFQELAERIRFHNGSVSLVAKLRIDLRDGGADTFRFSWGGVCDGARYGHQIEQDWHSSTRTLMLNEDLSNESYSLYLW